MSCKAYRDMLHSYVNNELNEIQQTDISEHLKSCTACSNELTEIKSLKKILITLKSEGFQLGEIKGNIMSTIRASKKKAVTYDIKVLTRLANSMIACGVIAMVLNFTSLGDGLTQYTGDTSTGQKSTEEQIGQPMTFINNGLTNISDGIVSLDGIIFRTGQRLKGGM